jgi:ATP-dependent Clp protease adaptor protein ClpS
MPNESTTPAPPGGTAILDPAPATTPAPSKPRPKQPVPWSVILLDDDDHTVDYVVHMMQRLFGHTIEAGVAIAKTVDSQGRAVVFTTHKELAELKRDQILGFGADPLLARCAGSMSAVIEPAAGSDDQPPSDNNRKPS